MRFHTMFGLRIRALLFALLPIIFVLRWLAINIPISSNEFWVDTKWIDDRFVVVQHQYLPYRYGLFRPYQCVFREYLIDCDSQTRTHLRGNVSAPDYSPVLPAITPNGSIVRLNHEDEAWNVHRINPRSLTSTDQRIGPRQPIVVGDCFLVVRDWDSSRDIDVIQWYKLDDSTLTMHTADVNTYGGVITAVDGSNAFFSVASNPGSGSYGDESFGNGLLSAGVEPRWCSDLRDLNQPDSPAHRSFQGDIEMLHLYTMTERGPVPVASWPVVGGSGYVTVQSDTGLLATLDVSAASFNVHDGITGKLISSIPIPGNAIPSDFRPHWSLTSSVLKIYGTNGVAIGTFDALTGEEIPTSNCLDRSVYDRHDNLYITIQDTDTTKPENWPLELQVRELPTGSIISSFPNLDFQTPEFGLDGSSVKYVDYAGKVSFLSSVTGNVLRSVEPAKWTLTVSCLFIVIVVGWMLLWFYECNRSGVPVVLRSGVLTCVALFFLTMRLQLSGHDQFFERFAWQTIFAIVTGLVMAVVLRAMQPNTSITKRVVLVIACSLVSYELGSRLISSSWAQHRTFFQFAVSGLLLLIWGAGLRFAGRLQSNEPARPFDSKFSLSTLLIWITLAALVAGVLARVQWADAIRALNSSSLMMSLLVSLSRTSVAIATWWSVRNIGKRFVVSLLSLGLIVAITISAHAYYLSDGFNPLYASEGFWYAGCCVLPMVIVIAAGYAEWNFAIRGRSGRPTTTQ